MAASNRLIQLGIRLSKFQEINAGACNRLQASRDSANFYSSWSSNSFGHRQISQLDKPIGKGVDFVDTIVMAREANLSKFKSEILNSQEHQFALLRNDIDKMRVELRYEIDKSTTGLRLDLKQDIHELMADFDAVKYDVIKYSIGTLVSLSVVGIGMIHIFATK